MGAYAKAIVATKLIAKKDLNSIFHERMETEELLNMLKKWINLDLYEIIDDKDYVILKIDPTILRKNIKDFVLEQLDIIGDMKESTRKNTEILLDLIKDNKMEMEDINEYAYAHEYTAIRFFDYGCYNLRYLCPYLFIYCEGIEYLYEGKVSMEDFSDFSTYLHRLIRLYSKNPLKDAVILDFDA